MNLHPLFPFGIRAGHDTVGADAVTILTAGVHLERRNARRLGWRGLRPSMGTGHAWTMRLAGRDGIYGLAFLDEKRVGGALHSRFSVFYFPDPAEPLLRAHVPDARRAAALPGYFAGIREFPQWEASALFFLGELQLDVCTKPCGVGFSLEAPSRHRVIALDGLPSEGLEPGAAVCDIPAFRLGVPFLRLLALSASSLLKIDPEWAISRVAYPLPAFTADGEWGALEGETVHGAVLSARFGILPYPAYAGAGTKPLSGRAFTVKDAATEDDRPVLHIVSGFLGSGKTTFLSEWLSWLHNHDRHTAVLQNELGARSLDAALLEYETVSEALDEGCVCCTLADSLRPGIRRLTEKLATEEIILETTGVANPGAVADALADLGDMVRPGLCVTLVDASGVGPLLAKKSAQAPGLMEEQILRADVLVCNKIDGIPQNRLDAIISALKRMNPDAAVFAASFGRIPFGELDRLRESGQKPGSRAAAALRPRGAPPVTHRDEGYSSLMFTVTRPMHEENVASIVRFAQKKALRIKGIVDSIEENRPVIVQYASGTLALEQPLSSPGPERFLVFIGKGFDAAFETSLAQYPGLERPVRT